MKIIDFSKDGHHEIYQKNILKIEETELLVIEKNFSLRKNGFKYFKEIKDVLDMTKNEDVHYLTLDFIFKYPLLNKLNKSRIVIGTLHKEPDTVLKKFLLKNFSKKISKIIVHSEFMKTELEKIGIYNVEVIEYPTFYNYSNLNRDNLRKEEGINNKIVISSLGGTRLDKGIDILLEAFKYIDKNIKNNIVLNIAGKEEYFKKETIRKIAEKNEINLREKYGFLVEEEFIKNVLLTDIMIMPYRKVFSGNSGPMTEAIVNKIPSLVPEGTNIGDLTKKYDLGETFEAENSKDLADVLISMINNKKQYFTTDYFQKLKIDNFLKKHKKLYLKLQRGK